MQKGISVILTINIESLCHTWECVASMFHLKTPCNWTCCNVICVDIEKNVKCEWKVKGIYTYVNKNQNVPVTIMKYTVRHTFNDIMSKFTAVSMEEELSAHVLVSNLDLEHYIYGKIHLRTVSEKR